MMVWLTEVERDIYIHMGRVGSRRTDAGTLHIILCFGRCYVMAKGKWVAGWRF